MSIKRELAVWGMAIGIGAVAYGVVESNPVDNDSAPSPSPTTTSAIANCAFNGNLAATDPACVAPTPHPTKLTPASIELQMSEAQAGLQAVSAEKLDRFVSLIEARGEDDNYPNGKFSLWMKRYIFTAPNGDNYTDYLKFSKPYGHKGSQLKEIDVFLQKPGETKAQHVIQDGLFGPVADGVKLPVDGVVDIPYGYNKVTKAEIKRDSRAFSLDAIVVEALRAMQSDSLAKAAQHDYAQGVDAALNS